MSSGSRELLTASALEQARLIRERRVSSEELVRLYLARIERHNPELQAFVQVLGRRALRHARGKDREVAKGATLPPFHGVPIGVKDLNLVRGAFSRMGSRAFRGLWSPVDDKTVSQLRRGGFVVLGKLATSELGAMPVTEPDLHPPTRNPWQPERSSGGSSGGSGSAVAAGLLPIAQGSDGAGSIRIPSSFCHLYGLKPSRGRVANAYGAPDRHILYTDGPLARTVGDAAALLDVMAGISVGRPHWAPPPPRPFAALCAEPPGRLRIGLLLRSRITPVDPEVEAAVRGAARALEGLGHAIEELAPAEGDVEEFLPLWQFLVGAAPLVRWSKVQPVTRWLGEAGHELRAPEVAALAKRLSERFLAWSGGVDLVLSPSTPAPAPRVGAFAGLQPREAFLAAAPIGAFTAMANVTGQPAASLPLAVSAAGLPIGVQLAGRPLGDALVLAVSRQLELALPWAGRAAPLLAEA